METRLHCVLSKLTYDTDMRMVAAGGMVMVVKLLLQAKAKVKVEVEVRTPVK